MIKHFRRMHCLSLIVYFLAYPIAAQQISSIGTFTLLPPAKPLYAGSVLRFEALLVNTSERPLVVVEDETFTIELYDAADPTHTDLFFEQRKKSIALKGQSNDASHPAFVAAPGRTEKVSFLIGNSFVDMHPGLYTLIVSGEDVGTKQRLTTLPLSFTLLAASQAQTKKK